MNTIQLNNQWSTIVDKEDFELKYIRIDGYCIPDLFLAINENNRRCLLLKLPDNYAINFKGQDKENLRTYYSEENNFICIELLDNFYNLLFNDLIISLYYKIKDISDITESTNTFISTINKWASFFENCKNSKLNKDQIKGLIGELIQLRELIISAETPQSSIDDFLLSWRGPYDENRDFVLEDQELEVKTKNKNSLIVRISTENQLDEFIGKELKLVVVSLDSESNSTMTLESIFDELRDLTLQYNGNLSILTDAIAQKNLFPSNLKDYSDYTFTLSGIETFDCLKTINEREFPRIRKSDLPEDISDVRYNINLKLVTEFLIDKKEF